MVMRVHIEWCDQFGFYHHYQTMNHLQSARRIAESRASSTGKKHRIMSDDGTLLDIIF
tara:strand:+ start:722 stop:895 length:174 start_codon:yes stop_codon:yes gene_type:complete